MNMEFLYSKRDWNVHVFHLNSLHSIFALSFKILSILFLVIFFRFEHVDVKTFGVAGIS